MNLYGRMEVNLSEEREFDYDEFAQVINQTVRPPREVRGEDINVRAIYLVSDRVNSYGGRFPREELENLCAMVIDSPVLVGHARNELPIARNFKAEVVSEGDENWVKVWFYWLKEADGSEALLANLDGGIYKEGSIGFVFSLPECGICGRDIRDCEHTPLKKYLIDGSEKTCYYNYRNIEKVLETSLVFRGANPNTRVTDELIIPTLSDESDLEGGKITCDQMGKAKIDEIRFGQNLYVGENDECFLAPLYFGLPVECCVKNGRVEITADGKELRLERDNRLVSELKGLGHDRASLKGQLFKLRGKQKLPLFLWKDFTSSSELKGRYYFLVESVFDNDSLPCGDERPEAIVRRVSGLSYIRLKKYRRINGFNAGQAEKMASRWGIELISSDGRGGRKVIHYRKPYYLIAEVVSKRSGKNGKHVYRIRFKGGKPSECWNTYETGIAAQNGDSLLVRAVRWGNGGDFGGFVVEDNLGGYYQADNLNQMCLEKSNSERYWFHAAGNSAILKFDNVEINFALMFPQFEVLSPGDDKTLIGYAVSTDAGFELHGLRLSRGMPYETGHAIIEKTDGHCVTLRLNGKTFEGRYLIRPAFWGKKELVLFSRLG
jgi:hypothetical protein